MPTYVYTYSGEGAGCDTCSTQFEKVQRITADPIEGCPDCGGDVRRVVQPVNLNFSIVDGQIADSRLKDAGFTKIEKDGEGGYRKAFGHHDVDHILDDV